MGYAQKTHTATNGAPFQIDLGQDCGAVVFLATVDTMWRVDAQAPTAPGADPVAGNNATASYIRLKANVPFTLGQDMDGRGKVTGLQDPIRYVTGWSYGAGHITVVGH